MSIMDISDNVTTAKCPSIGSVNGLATIRLQDIISLSEQMMAYLGDVYTRHSASMI